MFKNKKNLNENNDKLQRIEKEKQELLKIKEMLNDESPKVDITDVYVLCVEGNDEKFIIKKCIKEVLPGLINFTLVDIFSNNILYNGVATQNSSFSYAQNKNGEYNFINLHPICKVEKDLLMYTDKNVPLYVLQQTYYNLNNIDITKTKGK